MASSPDTQRDWVRRVLGVSASSQAARPPDRANPPDRASPPDRAKLTTWLAAWQTALGLSGREASSLKQTIADRIAAAEPDNTAAITALDARWRGIEQDLSGLARAIEAIAAGGAEPAAIRTAVDGARQILDASPLLSTIDQNTLQPVAVAGRLRAALDQLQQLGGQT